ncbi:fibronectin type III domain-containing protein, partial [Bacillus thuringiensis]|nr:fibronectin type III domain-containing protein [Bacillus thuringiensis]
KKCGFLLVFALMFCFAIPNFASAAVVDLLEGKTGVMEKTGKEYKNMTDGNMSTFDDLLSSNFVIFDLDDVYTIDKYVVNEGKNGTNLASFYVRYYSSDHKMIKTYREISSTEKVEGIRYIGIKYDYLYAMRIFDFKVLGTTDKVTNVENLKAEVGLNEVTLSWVNPDTPKFTGVNIYQGKRLLGKLDKSKNSYVVKGLESAKEYDFTVKSIDENDFETSGAKTKVSTKMPVLPPPDKVFVTPQNGKLVIAWNGVSSLYL